MSYFHTLPDFRAISLWMNRFVDERLKGEAFDFDAYVGDNPLPEITTDSRLGDFIKQHELDAPSRFVLLFLMERYENPELVCKLIGLNNPYALYETNATVTLTAYSFRRLLNKPLREVAPLFGARHTFYIRSIIQLQAPPSGLPEHHGVVEFVPGIYEMFITNIFQSPRFGEHFPAKHITTTLGLNDLIIPDYLREKMNIVITQPVFENRLRVEFGMDKQMPRGFRVLLIGPPGTGKTMAAAVMGRLMDRDVYQVMLSQVLNKYIGESEKNLDRLFNMAEGKGWILFFDEADSLFGNRGEGEDAGSKNRNELISYLLQRIENFDGIVFAATNLEDNMDVAFKRRFQEHLRFNLPTDAESLALWEKYLPHALPLADEKYFNRLTHYKLPPSSIANVCNRVALYAASHLQQNLKWEDLEFEIKRDQRMLGINS